MVNGLGVLGRIFKFPITEIENSYRSKEIEKKRRNEYSRKSIGFYVALIPLKRMNTIKLGYSSHCAKDIKIGRETF